MDPSPVTYRRRAELPPHVDVKQPVQELTIKQLLHHHQWGTAYWEGEATVKRIFQLRHTLALLHHTVQRWAPSEESQRRNQEIERLRQKRKQERAAARVAIAAKVVANQEAPRKYSDFHQLSSPEKKRKIAELETALARTVVQNSGYTFTLPTAS